MEHRFATEADLDRLAAWNRELIEDERADNPMDQPALRERMRGWLAGEYRAVLFEEGGEPVAYALYRPTNTACTCASSSSCAPGEGAASAAGP